MRIFRFFAAASLVSTFATIVIGGYVSAAGFGLACPDWPTCKGALVPDLSDPAVLTEWSHRTVAAVTGLLVVITLILAIVWHRQERRLLWPAAFAVVFLVPQVILGMLAIASELEPIVVTSHLALAVATFASTWFLAIEALRAGAGMAVEAAPTG